ncbi:subtilase-type protease inhibitor [Nocardia sp. CDC153]|uniref:subtilase-type protease inhibitor n=1 Tax=Nocardia sp. CDC153 TaxID=3112167 RepID=UPI002DBD42DE|nr:subtilase-type protease inhibitor [Nocardia sp. CDC153]MEC3953906.1 subtilase-type protease inhibitor [Nocardia sp. CDC153]
MTSPRLRAFGASAGVLAALVAVPAAQAQPTAAHPTDDLSPSVLTLTFAQGDSLDTASSQRTVLLICSPSVLGTHPATAAACDELNTAGGDFERLSGHPMRFCTMIYDPVTVAADGVWHGNPVSYRHTYPNKCQAENRSTYVFAF